jgi:hypothetical protein
MAKFVHNSFFQCEWCCCGQPLLFTLSQSSCIYLVYKKSLTSSKQIGYIWNIARCIHNVIRHSHGFCGIWKSRNISMNFSKYSLKVWLIGKLVVFVYSKRKNYTCKWSPICYKGVDELKQAKIDVKMSVFLQFLLHLFMWCHFNGMWIMEIWFIE